MRYSSGVHLPSRGNTRRYSSGVCLVLTTLKGGGRLQGGIVVEYAHPPGGLQGGIVVEYAYPPGGGACLNYEQFL